MTPPECTPMLKALADDTRWRIVQHLLLQGRDKVTAIAELLQIAQPSISKHLRILREAGIIRADKERTTVWCSIVPEFRQKVQGGGAELNLGCCSFRFGPDDVATEHEQPCGESAHV